MQLLVKILPLAAFIIGVIVACSVKPEDVVEIAEKVFGPEQDIPTRRKT
jgi:hypothetical protein